MSTVKSNPFQRNRLIRDAIGRAIYEAMQRDSSIYLFGEGAEIKQHYDAPQIEKEFPHRVITLPISEDANTNFAVGASLLGVKPVVDCITSDFMYRAMDSICNSAAKLNFVAAEGQPPKTIVIRGEFLMGGPTTGQRPEALFCHIPDLNVVLPSIPRDAYGLMRTALAMPGVTIFFEDRMILDSEISTVEMMSVFPEERLPIPFGFLRHCTHPTSAQVTVVTYGLMRQVVEGLVWEHDFLKTVDLLDLRTLYPIDWPALSASVAMTGKLLIIEPDIKYGGIGAEIAAVIAEHDPGVRIKRLGAPRETIPANPARHGEMLPSRERVLEAIRGMI